MTFDELYGARLNLELNDSDSNVLYTSTRRQQAINDATREFSDLTECYIRRASIPVSCNTSEYVLSTLSDFTRLAADGVEYWRTDSNGTFTQQAGDDFPRRDEMWLHRHDVGWRQSTTPIQYPQGYYIRNSGGQHLLGLSEPPKVGAGDTVRLMVPYVAQPPAMTASTDVPFTDTSGNQRVDLTVYHQALPHYAAYKLLPLIGDMQGANAQLQTFLGYVSRYQQANRPRGGQHVMVARNYFRDSRRTGYSGDASLDRDARWRWR